MYVDSRGQFRAGKSLAVNAAIVGGVTAFDWVFRRKVRGDQGVRVFTDALAAGYSIPSWLAVRRYGEVCR